MKKILTILIAACLIMPVFTSCKKTETVKNEKKLSVVTTIFPEYDWVKEITKGSDNIDLTMLLYNGVDLHNYQPTADDILKIGSCDMFIYVGGESDKWVSDTLAQATNKDMTIINLLDVLGNSAKEENIIEGMEKEKDEEEADQKVDSPEYDEHVWLSIKNAKTLINHISGELEKKDPDNKILYEKNTKSYVSELNNIDKEYESAVNSANTKTLLFGDRFPFRYMTDDYNLNYFAAFVGCSAESEASFETISFLSNKINELKLQTIIKIDGSDGKIAEAIRNTTYSKDQQILTLNSMQSVKEEDLEQGQTYLEILKSNLEVLKEAMK